MEDFNIGIYILRLSNIKMTLLFVKSRDRVKNSETLYIISLNQ